MKELFERTSVRDFTTQRIERDKLDNLLRAAMCAPSSGNEQPWHFIVLDRPADFLPIMDVSPHVQMLETAQCAILVCGDPTQQKYRFDFWVQDCSAATENLLIEAKHLGLGAVWCGIYPDQEKIVKLRTLYGIPNHIQVLCVVAVGYPAKERKAKDRYKPHRVHVGSWGQVLTLQGCLAQPEFEKS